MIDDGDVLPLDILEYVESALDLDLDDVNLLSRDCSDWADITPEKNAIVTLKYEQYEIDFDVIVNTKQNKCQKFGKVLVVIKDMDSLFCLEGRWTVSVLV